MEIRDANLDDLPAIVAIYNTTIASRMVTADLEPVTIESRRSWFEQHGPGRRPLWVGVEERQVIGWLSYSSFYGRPAYNATCEVSVYLAPSHRGKGLGGEFLQHCIRFAPNLGVTTLLGFIFGHNTPSIRLFTKLGFERWGLLPGIAVLDGIERDLVILGRRV
jgi:L-amino acid N-acyltransferase YncA